MQFYDLWADLLGDRLKFVLSPGIILCGWLGSKHQLTLAYYRFTQSVRSATFPACVWDVEHSGLLISQCAHPTWLRWAYCATEIHIAVVIIIISIKYFTVIASSMTVRNTFFVWSHSDFSHGKFGLFFPGKASCDRVALPNLGWVF